MALTQRLNECGPDQIFPANRALHQEQIQECQRQDLGVRQGTTVSGDSNAFCMRCEQDECILMYLIAHLLPAHNDTGCERRKGRLTKQTESQSDVPIADLLYPETMPTGADHPTKAAGSSQNKQQTESYPSGHLANGYRACAKICREAP
jgi:hypothetical protein